MNKSKKRWLMEAIRMGGIAVDMCRDCSLKKLNEEFICTDCPSAYRKFPGWPGEDYFNQNYRHGRGSA